MYEINVSPLISLYKQPDSFSTYKFENAYKMFKRLSEALAVSLFRNVKIYTNESLVSKSKSIRIRGLDTDNSKHYFFICLHFIYNG